MGTSRTGFIGLGNMGGPMAGHLLTQSGALWVHDRTAEAVAPLAAQGAEVAQSPAEMAAGVDLVLTCLPDTEVVRAVLFGPEGVLAASRDGLLIVDCSTLDRADTLALAAEAAEAGASYCDCPISGALPGARAGTLTSLFGGTAAQFERARPVLEPFSAQVLHCGPVGSGQAMKAINNILYNINIAALCEVLPMTVAAGLDPQIVATLVTTGSARSFAAEHFVPRILDRRFDTDFAMQSAYKDIVNVNRLAQETGANVPLVRAMTEAYEAALRAGLGAEPKSAMIKLSEDALGVEFKA